MKKVIIALLLTTLLLGTTKVFALENLNEIDNYLLINSESKEKYELNQQISEQRLNQIKLDSSNGIMPSGGGSFISLTYLTGKEYPNYRQETSYWCGPASIKQAVQWINNTSNSQQVYATSMGTNSKEGSYVWKMARELNNRQSQHSYVYVDISTMNNKQDFWLMVQNDILMEKVPAIAHAKTNIFYMYNGKNLGHYLTLTGYYEDYLSSEFSYFEYVDSYYADYGRGSVFGTHEVNFYDLYNSLHNTGRFMIW